MKVSDILHTGADGLIGRQEESAPAWIVTYADMVTLLLCFFILIVAISQPDPSKVEQVTQSTQEALGTTGAEKRVQVLDINELVKAVERIIAQEKMQSQVEVAVTNRGVVISGKGATFFQSGESTVLPKAVPLLKKLAKQINRVPYQIAVEGHTDNVPIRSAVYPSNWELSAARAGQIVRFLVSSGVKPQRLSAVGLADTRPKRPNATESNRAINRRIEIVFLTR